MPGPDDVLAAWRVLSRTHALYQPGINKQVIALGKRARRLSPKSPRAPRSSGGGGAAPPPSTGSTRDDQIRARIVREAFYLYGHRLEIQYRQSRPIQLVRPPAVPTELDCSGFATLCYFAAGAPDPNGLGYSGAGYTGTLIQHGVRVGSLGQMKRGDLIFYYFASGSTGFGRGAPTHVAVYIGLHQKVPSVVSMGSYPMKVLPWNYGTVNHLRHYEMSPARVLSGGATEAPLPDVPDVTLDPSWPFDPLDQPDASEERAPWIVAE